METLRFESPFEKQGFIKAQLIRWQIQWLRNKHDLIKSSIISLVVLIIGILAITEKEPTNPFLYLGILFSTFTLLILYLRIFALRKFKLTILEIAEKYDVIKMDCSYEFTDETIKYWDKEKIVEFKWSVFSYYSIYKGYLIIALENSLFEMFIFEKRGTEDDEYEKILEFVQSKIAFKEIK